MKKIVTSLACLCLLGMQANAAGYRVSLQGQKQIGMAHAGAGLALDASSVFFNPGGLCFTPNSLSVGGNLLMPRIQFLDGPTQTTTNAVANNGTPFSIYANYGITKKLSFGLGAYSPYGSKVEYPAAWTGRFALTSISLQAIYLQPTLSYKINDNIGVGAGFIYGTGKVNLQRDLDLLNANGKYANLELDGAAKGMGAKFGVYYQKNKFSGSLNYQTLVNMKAENKSAIFNNVPVAASASIPATNTFTTTLPLPGELTLGLGYKINKKLTVVADYILTQWSVYDTLGIDFGTNTTALADSRSARMYKNTSTVRIGGSYMINNKITARAGAFYDQTPIQDGYVTPESPDNNRVGGTLGASYNANKDLSIDLSFMYQSVPKRLQTNTETGLNGSFSSKVVNLGFGLTYNFGSLINKKKTVTNK